MTAFLQRFINVRRGEAGSVVASALFFFCVLTALMVVRPARESVGMRSGSKACAGCSWAPPSSRCS